MKYVMKSVMNKKWQSEFTDFVTQLSMLCCKLPRPLWIYKIIYSKMIVTFGTFSSAFHSRTSLKVDLASGYDSLEKIISAILQEEKMIRLRNLVTDD